MSRKSDLGARISEDFEPGRFVGMRRTNAARAKCLVNLIRSNSCRWDVLELVLDAVYEGSHYGS
jgi:hypothetical protein